METIYDSIYRGLVNVSRDTLRTGRIYRHKRGRGRTREGALKQLAAIRSIHDRPTIGETRQQIGHLEGDLILGSCRQTAIATLVDRKTRYTILVPIRGGWTAQHVGDMLITTFNALPASLHRTLTWDQGNEMFHHARVEAATGTKIYFADPHSPWQRGTNEKHQWPAAPSVLSQGERLQHPHRPAASTGRRRAQPPAPTVPRRQVTSTSHATMAPSLDQRLIRNDDWNPPGLCRCVHRRNPEINMVKIRDGQVRNRPIYAATGVDLDGHKDILGMGAGNGDGESAKFWLAVLTELKNRGVKDVFFVVCDGLKGLPDSVNAVFPLATVQTSSADTVGGEMVSLVTAPSGENLCRRVAFEALTQTCSSRCGDNVCP